VSSAPPHDLDESGFRARLLDALPALRGYVVVLAARSRTALEPDDVLQDVAARALRYQHAHDGERALLPWLRRTALNLVLDAQQRAARRPLPLDAGAEPAAEPSPDAGAQREELERLLARLEPLPRELLLRFHRDGQSVAEIAAALALPEGTVKSHLHRARRRLREAPGGTP